MKTKIEESRRTPTVSVAPSPPADEQASERRVDARFASADRARARWEDSAGVPHREDVRICNVSFSGLAFRSRRFRVGDRLSLWTDQCQVRCIVRHVQSGDVYHIVGVETLSAVARTSP